jgi:type II secretory pathway pseudopilin PulG
MESRTASFEAAAGRCLCNPPNRHCGYTYVMVLVLLAVLSLASALTLEVAETSARRSAEAELLAVGQEFDSAFASYYRHGVGPGSRYPQQLEDLLRDPRSPGVRRHLRRLYSDPLTGAAWATIAAPGGGIMGVYSMAPGQPYKLHATPLAVVSGASAPAQSYAEWRFGYDPAMEQGGRMRIITVTPDAKTSSP